MNPRRLTPELLDSLSPTDPAALASRRDLQRLHPLLGQHNLWIGWLRQNYPSTPPATLADLGCGDAHLLSQVLPLAFPDGGSGGKLLLVDRQPSVPPETLDQFRRQNWDPLLLSSDVFAWAQSTATSSVDLILTNLFLHHFTNAQLMLLFPQLQRVTHYFAAAEPRRGLAGSIGFRLLPLLGCHSVTLHDARVSVEAGFTNTELSSLWSSSPPWQCSEQRAGLFTHFFSAKHRE